MNFAEIDALVRDHLGLEDIQAAWTLCDTYMTGAVTDPEQVSQLVQLIHASAVRKHGIPDISPDGSIIMSHTEIEQQMPRRFRRPLMQFMEGWHELRFLLNPDGQRVLALHHLFYPEDIPAVPLESAHSYAL